MTRSSGNSGPASGGAPALRLPRRRHGRRRQIALLLLLLSLLAIICGYWIVTDPSRVRPMAEHYLSKIVGGRVHVKRAYLSLFEGLRLEGVRVYVGDPARPDSLVFSAQRFDVRARLWALLSGRLEATKIMALDPHVHVCENLDADEDSRWNYFRLERPQVPEAPTASDRPIALPEIMLRAGMIEYARIRGGRYEAIGVMAIDGQLTPDMRTGATARANRYLFELDSRAGGLPIGPHLSGTIDMDGPSVSASLQNVEFSRTVRLMLPSEVQTWWEAHQLSGQIRIPRFQYTLGTRGRASAFHIEVQLDGVQLAILPEEMLGTQDYRRMSRFRPCFQLGNLADIGFVGRTDWIESALQPQPVWLSNVSGLLVFTPQQIRIAGLTGKIANTRVSLEGAVSGYHADAALSLRLVANHVQVPPRPRYLASLPPAVRKVHKDFQPHGQASLAFEIRRDERGGALRTTGEVNVLNGAFSFDEFPYPLHGITGTIRLGIDPRTREDRIDLLNLRGFGLEGTRNAHNGITVNGWVSPISQGSGVEVHISGSEVCLDPPLRAALPVEARSVMTMFDMRPRSPDGKAFALAAADDVVRPVDLRGGFDAWIRRAPGPKQKLTVEVDLDVRDGQGEFSAFPYRLRNLAGRVLVRPHYTDVKDLVATHGDSTVRIDGRVYYGGKGPANPDIRVKSSNLHIDDDLLLALPDQQRQWMQKAGVDGRLDIDGRVFLPSGATSTDQTDFDLRIALRDGAIWPVGSTHAVTDATADLRLSKSELLIHEMNGRRGVGRVSGRGRIAWPTDQPEFNLTADASDIALDNVLYQIVPSAGQRTWDKLRPEGTVDLSIAYTGGMAENAGPATRPAPTTQPYKIVIRQKNVALTPPAFPWRMESITGIVIVTPERTTLQDIVARHGRGTLKLNGQCMADSDDRWELSLSGERISLDDSLRQALWPAMRDVFDRVKPSGSMSFDCPKLICRTVRTGPADTNAAKAASTAVTQVEIEKARIMLADASLETDIPLSAINGGLTDLLLVVRGGTVDELSARLDVPSLELAQRPTTGLRGNLKKISLAGHSIYRFTDVEATLCGGKLSAPVVGIDVPARGSVSYGLRLVLNNIDVRSLVGDIEENVKGRFNGSLDLAGNWSDPATRLGRGEVLVQGRELYRLPLVFGWLQIANLALPIKSPFNEATASYSIRGHKLALDRIELRTPTVTMQGFGTMDFDTKRVAMTFLTDNPNWPRIPVVGELLDLAKHELLQIRVTGTINEPQVRAKSMNTFTTTIEEVFGERQQSPKKDRK